MSRFSRTVVAGSTLVVGVIVLAVFVCVPPAQAQVACGEVGNHVIKVAKGASTRLSDCQSARISKKGKHSITWQAQGNDTVTLEWGSKGNPFVGFTCKDQKQCKAADIDPNASGSYKYSIVLKSGTQTYREDPDVMIEP